MDRFKYKACFSINNGQTTGSYAYSSIKAAREAAIKMAKGNRPKGAVAHWAVVRWADSATILSGRFK